MKRSTATKLFGLTAAVPLSLAPYERPSAQTESASATELVARGKYLSLPRSATTATRPSLKDQTGQSPT